MGKAPSKKKVKHTKSLDGHDSKDTESSEKIRHDPSPSHAESSIEDLTAAERCDLVAGLGESVLEDPTAAFLSPRKQQQKQQQEHDGDNAAHVDNDDEEHQHDNRSKVRKLLDLADPAKNGNDVQTSRLATLSLLAIFQDVLPTYRIRLPTAAELAVRVGRDTKKLWDYERALLNHYQSYLKLLEKMWESGKGGGHNGVKPTLLSVTSILCLCELLKSATHFNFRSNILSVVVRQMNNRYCDEVSEACCKAVSHVFATDAQGEIALEAARLVAKVVKDKTGRIRPSVLRTFLSLPLRVHEDEAQAAKLAAAAQAKKRKRDKEGAEIEDELREGKATVDKITLARCQADTLQTVTLTYFRILKSEDLTLSRVSELLPPALEGLAKFAHLINIDVVVDLLAVLKDMLKRVEELPLDATLNCVLTAFQTLQGPGREMQIDQKEFVTPLYTQLPRLCTEGCSQEHTELMLRCLYAAFIKRREYSTVRVAAFVKQLCTVSLHAPQHTSAPFLAFVRLMLQRYPSVDQLLENEQDVITSGKYTPDVEDPEFTNPFATSAWELATLRFHINPAVSEQASGAASARMLQLPEENPDRIRANMIRDANEGYIAHRISKKKHPLAGGRSNGSKRKRKQMRFITPRRTGNFHLP